MALRGNVSLDRLITGLCPVREPRVKFLFALLAAAPLGPREASDMAAHLGLPSRFALARLLRHHGLPPLRDLRDMVRVLSWVWRWERERMSLMAQARHDRFNVWRGYRTVQKVTGRPWTAVRGLGTVWLVARLREQLGGRPSHRRSTGVTAPVAHRTG